VDLDLTPEEERFQGELRRWLRDNVPARAARAPRSGPREELGGARLAALKAWQRALDRAGYVAIGWPREYGGRGATVMEQTILGEELVRARAPALIGQMGLAMVGPTLIQWGTEAQKRELLPKIRSAEHVWCQGYSEPGAGSDLASLQTRARREGDHFVVSGRKIWTSNAQIADLMFCLVRTNPDAPKHHGISYVLIDMRSPGIELRPLVQMTGDAGFNEVLFDGVRVPVENLVGPLDEGWKVANTTLVHERNMLGSTTQTQQLFEGLLRVARRARRGGRPASEDPLVRQRLAELKIRVEALRCLAYRNLTAALHRRKGGIEASITKLATTELNHELARTAIELLGLTGPLYRGSLHLEDGGLWPYQFMFSLGMIIGGGTSQIQKNIIAQRGLGLPRSA
jgi:alkylation response protein AidB-like acyl-CoA dehydrogenase